MLLASIVSDCDFTDGEKQATVYEVLNHKMGIDWGDSFHLVRNNGSSTPALGHYREPFGEIESHFEAVKGLLDSGVLDHIHGVFSAPPTAIALKGLDAGDGGTLELPFDLDGSTFFPLRVMTACTCLPVVAGDSHALEISASHEASARRWVRFQRARFTTGRRIRVSDEVDDDFHTRYCRQARFLVNFDPLDVLQLLKSWVNAFGPLPSLLTDHSGTAFLNDSAVANRQRNVRLFDSFSEEEHKSIFQITIPGLGSLLVDAPGSLIPLAGALYSSGVRVINPSGISGRPRSRPMDLPVEKTIDRSGTPVWIANRILPPVDPGRYEDFSQFELSKSRLATFAQRATSVLRSPRSGRERFAPIYTHLGAFQDDVDVSKALDLQANLRLLENHDSDRNRVYERQWTREPSLVHWIRASNLYCGSIVEASSTKVLTRLRSTRLLTSHPDAWFWGITLYSRQRSRKILLGDKLVRNKIVRREKSRWQHVLLPEMHIQVESLREFETREIVNSIGMPQLFGLFLSSDKVIENRESACLVHLDGANLKLCIGVGSKSRCAAPAFINLDSYPDHVGYRWVGAWNVQLAVPNRWWMQGLGQSFSAQSFTRDTNLRLAFARPRTC
jgi:hypothetical protein